MMQIFAFYTISEGFAVLGKWWHKVLIACIFGLWLCLYSSLLLPFSHVLPCLAAGWGCVAALASLLHCCCFAAACVIVCFFLPAYFNDVAVLLQHVLLFVVFAFDFDNLWLSRWLLLVFSSLFPWSWLMYWGRRYCELCLCWFLNLGWWMQGRWCARVFA